MLISQREIKMKLVSREGYNNIRNDAVVSHIIEKCKEKDVGLLVVDPLVKIHGCDESDNAGMDYVMETLTDIAHESDIAVMALHHVSKGGERQESRIGNADISRGASAVINAARIAFTLMHASNQDAEDYGMQDNERYSYVRLDDAKMNLSMADGRATWFRKEGVKIPSLDVVGVMKHEQLDKSRQNLRQRIGRILIETMTANGTGTISMTAALAQVKTREPLLANKTDADLKKRIEGFFSIATNIDGKELIVERDEDGKNLKIIMR